MKQHLMRTLSLLLLLTAVLGLFAGCGEKPQDDRVVATHGKTKFTFDEFRYFFMNCKKDLDGGDESVWENNEDLKKKLTDEILYRFKRVVAIQTLAEEYDLEMTKEDEEVVRDYIKSMEESFASEKEYEETLESRYMSRYTLLQVLRSQYLFEKLRNYLTDETNFTGEKVFPFRADDEALYADLEVNFYRGVQILIRNDEKDNPQYNKNLAEQLLQRLKDGEDFFDLVEEYGEDPGMDENGYYFTSGQLLAYFEDGVKELEIGQYSDVIECVHGYAIVMRLEMEDDYIKKNLETLRDNMKLRLFDEMLEEVIEETVIETKPLFYQMTVETMK